MSAAAKSVQELTHDILLRELRYVPETGEFFRRSSFFSTRVGEKAGFTDSSTGYMRVSVLNKNQWAHRLAWFYMTGAWPKHQIDHINRVRDDNRWVNLRDVAPTLNLHNTKVRCDNKSGVKGVYWSPRDKCWYAEIKMYGKKTRLGAHKEKSDAVKARAAAERRIEAPVNCNFYQEKLMIRVESPQTGDNAIEREIKAKGLTAPRVTPADIEGNILYETHFTAAQGAIEADGDAGHEALSLLTFCVLVLNNGFTVTGESACASPENFDAEIGRKIARENAKQKIWPLMGYALKQQLSA